MNASMIGLIITGVALLFVLFGMIINMIRGFKKSWIRGVIILGIAILCLFITPPITKAAVNIDISAFNLQVEGETAHTVVEYAELTLQQQEEVKEYVEAGKDVIELLMGIVTVIINTIVYVVLFWLLKFLSWVVYAIVMACTIGKKRRRIKKLNKKAIKNHSETVVLPKKVWWGGLLVGIVSGLFIGSITLMPVMQFSKLMVTIDSLKVTTSENEEKGLIEAFISESDNQNSDDSSKNTSNSGEAFKLNLKNTLSTTLDASGENVYSETIVIQSEDSNNSSELATVYSYLYSYENSPICKIYRYTGLEAINSLSFKYLTTTKVADQKLSLTNEVKGISKIAQSVYSLKDFDIEKADKDKLAGAIDNVNDILDAVFDSAIANIVGDSVLPVAFENIENGKIDLEIEDSILSGAVKDFAKEFKTIKMADIKFDYNKVLDAVRILNNENLIVETIKAEDKTTTLTNVSTEIINKVVDKIFEMNTVTKAVPILVNTGVEYLGEKLEFEVEKNTETLTKEQIKTSMTNLFTGFADVYKSLDLDSKYYVTENSFDKLGDILNEVKDTPLVTTKTYKNLVGALTNKINEKIDEMEFANADMKGHITTIVSHITNVENWKTETNAIKNVFNNIKTLFDDGFTEDSVKANITIFGKVLDSLKQGTIVTDADIKALTKDVFTTLTPEDADGAIKNIITTCKNRVDNISTDSKAFETEFSYIDLLFKNLSDFSNVEDTTDVSREVMLKIGKVFDDLKPSVLFYDTGTTVFKYLLDQVDIIENPTYAGAVAALRLRIETFDPEKDSYVEIFEELATIKDTVDTFEKFSKLDVNSITSEDVDELIDAISNIENLSLLDFAKENEDISSDLVVDGLEKIKESYVTDPTKADEIQNIIDNIDSLIDDDAETYTDKYKDVFDSLKDIVVVSE